MEDVIDLNRTLVLEQFPPAPEVQNSRDFFLSSSLGAETVSDIQFTVMLAQLGLKVIYGDDFENFCATQFQRLDRSGNGAGCVVFAFENVFVRQCVFVRLTWPNKLPLGFTWTISSRVPNFFTSLSLPVKLRRRRRLMSIRGKVDRPGTRAKPKCILRIDINFYGTCIIQCRK